MLLTVVINASTLIVEMLTKAEIAQNALYVHNCE